MATRRSKLAWQAAKFTGRTTERAVRVGLVVAAQRLDMY